MSEAYDLIVIGGGPAGVEAAIAATGSGMRTLLVDEALAAGGQVYRASPDAFRASQATPEQVSGADLRARLAESGVDTAVECTVWSISPGFRVDAIGASGPIHWQAGALVVAMGAQERVVPFPGWTLPGVVGLAGATILLKSQHMVPGRRTLVAGSGPLLFAVAAGILKAGGEVAAVVDLASRADWAAQLGALLSRPDLLARGLRWAAALQRAGVPILFRHAIRRIESADRELAVDVGPVDALGRPDGTGGVRRFEVDAAAVGNGLSPSTDVTRLLRAEHRYDPARGGWIAATDMNFRSSIRSLYVVGDGAGISGAAAAHLDGRIAGLSAAHDAGFLPKRDYEVAVTPLRTSAAKTRRFGQAMAELMALRPAQIDAIEPDTVICRCEDVTRREIDTAIGEGAVKVNQLKAWTRCGMGPCQGRVCGDIVGLLVARAMGSAVPPDLFTGRAPFRPLPLDQLIGEIDYADLALPPPAPL